VIVAAGVVKARLVVATLAVLCVCMGDGVTELAHPATNTAAARITAPSSRQTLAMAPIPRAAPNYLTVSKRSLDAGPGVVVTDDNLGSGRCWVGIGAVSGVEPPT
jgi:hypothetical protein